MVLTKQQRKKKNKKEKQDGDSNSSGDEGNEEVIKDVNNLSLDAKETENSGSKVKPKLTIICPYCKTPAEYCEFKQEWTKCKDWMESNAKHVLESILAAKERDAQNNKTTKTLKVKKEKDETVKKEEHQVTISISRRTKKKAVTLIMGLEAWDVNPKKACSYFKKRFACGAAEKTEPVVCIEIQGDVRDTILDVLEGEYKIPPKRVTILEEKKKKKQEFDDDESDDDDDDSEDEVPKKKTVKKVVKKEGEGDVVKKPKEKKTAVEGEEKPKKIKKKESGSSSDSAEEGPLNQKKEKKVVFGPKKEIKYEEKKPKIDFGPKGGAKGPKPGPKICAFFNSDKGCKQGDKCEFAHIKGESGNMPKKPCQYFGTEKGCSKGDTCPFSHVKPK